jgi:hypothetical protein
MSRILPFQPAKTDAAATVDAKVRFAIANRRLMQFHYGGSLRVVEPHDYGIIGNVPRLLVYQLSKVGSAGSQAIGWRLLDLPKIDKCVVLADPFSGTREDPNQEHYAWDVLYARVDGPMS